MLLTGHPYPGLTSTSSLPPSSMIKAAAHARLYRELAIAATPNGLLIKPTSESATDSSSILQISWGPTPIVRDVDISSTTEDIEWSDCPVVFGIVGIVSLFRVLNYPIYAVKEVVAIPLEERGAIGFLKVLREGSPSHLKRRESISSATSMDQSDALSASNSEEDAERFSDGSPVVNMASTASEGHPLPSITKSFFSRFIFWKSQSKNRDSTHFGSVPFQAGHQPLHSSSQQPVVKEMQHAIPTDSTVPDVPENGPADQEKSVQLDLKVIKQCIKLFSREMFFSYDFDITTALQRKHQKLMEIDRNLHLLNAVSDETTTSANVTTLSEPHPNFPLWRRVDRRFWWNEDISSMFVEAGLHDYVLPLMQGYIQFSHFSVTPERIASDIPEDCDDDEVGPANMMNFCIISPAGIDEDANVANFVETETILQTFREGCQNVLSYIQIRGSIPLYWSQSGASLKPVPTLDRTHSERLYALKRHFEKLMRYMGHRCLSSGPGNSVVLNLAETTGKEGLVTNEYRDALEEANIPGLSFDFHAECKGMKYENISKLITSLERPFSSQGFFWVNTEGVLSLQNGVFRVNCIDCLDRTNVVQSAIDRHMLDVQLQALAIVPSPAQNKEIDMIFNDVWANNGDAISRTYAGTSALKVYIAGMLNDGVNSLARMYAATFSDFLSQAIIDFVLGHRGLSVFTEFMTNMQATDPRELIRISKIRVIAIDICTALLVQEGEEVKGGWTLFSPSQPNIKISNSFEEKVLLLTSAALYIVSYDYSLDKVKVFTRVPFHDITGIQKGAYILSPMQEAGRDHSHNYGFVISYRPSKEVVTRATTYSIRNTPPPNPPNGDDPLSSSVDVPLSEMIQIKDEPTSFRLPSKSGGSSISKPEPKGRSSTLARAFSVVPTNTDIVEVAFKSLPVEYGQDREGSDAPDWERSSAGVTHRAKTCRENVEAICALIVRTCQDVGYTPLVTSKDVVSLEEARRSTPVFAKAEYAFKRLLWGG
ncbi:SacI homology domain-containing protein [Cantharellus anzutake]|uniref:SacI homology domain-containing protein n=1 Tax=Cantharellus anzutake TaxID=1750568 RepID=UPI00190602E2|nr:SacI homology domain-containing protein [Cantharellus anzutake]KAF8333945.1 SacI homology domain-containing protein [Cantharellus anzutake]